ncbi:hypothetical protein CYMTET_10842 [Cymbomonas tetramitiformis]|uniref:Protein kinase domain-containing protein n=1 Tax=Cymbomonas tetramitiformis TaxID=36881 RepID=A0AAE0GNG1_9CHLO|nr:hypothetical protein CYMTET_10842 [Cymbomonas tetramitiformis]
MIRRRSAQPSPRTRHTRLGAFLSKSTRGDVFYGIMALRDVQVRRHLAHENILSVQELLLPSSSSTFVDVYVVQESMDTDLRAVIKSQNSLSDDHIKYLMYNILSGIKHLHAANLVHRKLRPTKILLNRNDEVKISDFQHTCRREEIRVWMQLREETNECINRCDHLQHLRMVFKLIGSPNDDEVRACPTQAAEFVKSICCPKADLATVFPTATTLALDLLERMLCFDPKKRITAANALMHPYFSEFAHDDTPEAGSALECEVLPTMDCSTDCELACLDLDESKLREQFLTEIRLYHPE